jgi:hypothetical protein
MTTQAFCYIDIKINLLRKIILKIIWIQNFLLFMRTNLLFSRIILLCDPQEHKILGEKLST